MLVSSYGLGGGRIPLTDGSSLSLSRADLSACIDAMPTEACRAMHQAAQRGDLSTAQRLLREAAVAYASAPAPALPPMNTAARRNRRTRIA